MVQILRPFAEATDLLQGDSYATIGCVIPSVLAPHYQMQQLLKKIKHHIPLLQQLKLSLCTRFSGLLSGLQVPVSSSCTAEQGFNDSIYQMACVLDPSYSFQWLEHHHPGYATVKQQIRNAIIDSIVAEAENLNILSVGEDGDPAQ